jgi:hypothetical protein
MKKQSSVGRLNDVTDKAATTGARIAADVRAGLSNVVDGVKDKISGDSVRKIGEAAGKIRNYVDDRGVQGMSDDVTERDSQVSRGGDVVRHCARSALGASAGRMTMAKLDPMIEHGSWSELIAGIVSDATHLFATEIELAKLEVRADIKNAKSLLTGIAAGALIALLGTALLCVGGCAGSGCLYIFAPVGVLRRDRRRSTSGRLLFYCRGISQRQENRLYSSARR